MLIMLDMLKIPEQRKAMLIGKDGQTKQDIEKKTNTKLVINDGVEIEGEPLEVLKAKQIVAAIGRGFSPEIALKLVNENYQLIVINLGGETGKTQKRIMSRIIGTRGKCKNIIEKYTGAYICVYGKTISVIGEWSKAEIAEKAIDMIINGRKHAYVYKYLEEST
jgi:ribosomal RNA assembly protein